MECGFSLPDCLGLSETVCTARQLDLARSRTVERPAMADDSNRTAEAFLDNVQAAAYLKLSPRTLEKQRVNGGGPRFRKLGRRVVYAVADLEKWANARICDNTSDPNYGNWA